MEKNINKHNKAEIRKKELIKRKEKNQKLLFVSIVVIVFAVIGFLILMSMGDDNVDFENENIQESAVGNDDEILVPLAEIGSEAVFYSYNSNGVGIEYFILEGSDGDIHAAFNACDICYDAKKGYKQDGDLMRCVLCGLEFPVNGLGSENTGGGCWPSFLPIEKNNGNIVISISDLLEKRYLFE
jgi:uncharacterized membrane protein